MLSNAKKRVIRNENELSKSITCHPTTKTYLNLMRRRIKVLTNAKNRYPTPKNCSIMQKRVFHCKNVLWNAKTCNIECEKQAIQHDKRAIQREYVSSSVFRR